MEESSPPSSLGTPPTVASEVQEQPESWRQNDVGEPIAIIGFSLKLPGDATSVESFWTMLMEGSSTFSEFPKDRVNHGAHHSSDSDLMGTVCTMR